MSAKRLYLLDIEGTVAPIAFVYGRLFPYARAHFQDFLHRNRADAAVEADLLLLAGENRAETDGGVPRIESFTAGMGVSREQALSYLLWLMDRDRKSTALKSLQGKIWKAGFESGELQGELYPDVPEAVARWSGSGRVAIYSSGSVAAQELLFRYSIYGDLTPYISSYFDTRTGAKINKLSYERIAAGMQIAPRDAIFFSDVTGELDPAREAGFETRLVVREGNAGIDDAKGHIRVGSFDGI